MLLAKKYMYFLMALWGSYACLIAIEIQGLFKDFKDLSGIRGFQGCCFFQGCGHPAFVQRHLAHHILGSPTCLLKQDMMDQCAIPINVDQCAINTHNL